VTTCSDKGVLQAATCKPNVCTCPKGTPTKATGSRFNHTLCEVDGEEDCSACSQGYKVSVTTGTKATSQKCVKLALVCDANAEPLHGNRGNCTSALPHGQHCNPTCKGGYTITGVTTCSDKGVLQAATCKPNVCTCPKGTPTKATGSRFNHTLCEVDGQLDCATCNALFTLKITTGSKATSQSCIAITCDASVKPAHGEVGDCTGAVKAASSCQPTCHSGFYVSGKTSCSATGQMTAATCIQASCVNGVISYYATNSSANGGHGASCKCNDDFTGGGAWKSGKNFPHCVDHNCGCLKCSWMQQHIYSKYNSTQKLACAKQACGPRVGPKPYASLSAELSKQCPKSWACCQADPTCNCNMVTDDEKGFRAAAKTNAASAALFACLSVKGGGPDACAATSSAPSDPNCACKMCSFAQHHRYRKYTQAKQDACKKQVDDALLHSAKWNQNAAQRHDSSRSDGGQIARIFGGRGTTTGVHNHGQGSTGGTHGSGGTRTGVHNHTQGSTGGTHGSGGSRTGVHNHGQANPGGAGRRLLTAAVPPQGHAEL
jgi:hypothetical protein